MIFAPPNWITAAFTLLSLAVAAMALLLYQAGARRDCAPVNMPLASTAVAIWLSLHAGIASTGVLEVVAPVPAIAPYMAFNVGVALWLVLGPVGKRMSALPLWALVACQGFRVPVELLLHALYSAGQLPIQMTWESRNIDVLSGMIGLFVLVVILARRQIAGRRVANPLPRQLLLVFNIVGLALLANVVHTALQSAPLPMRAYMNDPPVLLPFHVPYTWIVSVHVFSALVYHLLFFRAYRATRGIT